MGNGKTFTEAEIVHQVGNLLVSVDANGNAMSYIEESSLALVDGMKLTMPWGERRVLRLPEKA